MNGFAAQAHLCRQLAMPRARHGGGPKRLIVARRHHSPKIIAPDARLSKPVRCSRQRDDGRDCAGAQATADAALQSYWQLAVGRPSRWWMTSWTSRQTRVTLGKTAGKDAASDKPTYLSLLGLERAQQYASRLLNKPMRPWPMVVLPDVRALAALADMVVRRSH